MVNIYHSLVESKLPHWNTVWGNCKFYRIEQQESSLRTVPRLLNKGSYLGSYSTWLLNVQQLIDFDSAALIFKVQNGLAPKYISDMFVPSNYIHGHNTWHAMNGLFNSHVNSTYSSSCFAQTGSRLWNKIPHYVWTAKTIDTFKTSLRMHFLSHI